MDKTILSGFITIIFFICKLLEAKVLKQTFEPKKIFRDSIIVFICIILGFYITDNFDVDSVKNKHTEAFTGTPDF